MSPYRTFKSAGRRRIFAEINMIPLIDVALVLLVIFMVITPFLLRSQVEVSIPKASSASQAPEKPLEITVTRSGYLFINARKLDWKNLEKEIATRGRGKSVLINADKHVSLETIIKIMDIAKRLKIGKLGIAAIPTGT